MLQYLKTGFGVAVLSAGALALSACGNGTPAATASVAASTFSADVTHEYFPLDPGVVWTYEGLEDGLVRHEVVRRLHETRLIDGVECTAIEENVMVDGEISEITTEWYAQDSDGSVWKFGEVSQEFEEPGEPPVISEDSWFAGELGGQRWMAFTPRPQVGDVILGWRPDGQDEYHVISTTATALVPAGIFEGCLQLLENPAEPEDTDIILYANGVGKISEQNASGEIVLIDISRE